MDGAYASSNVRLSSIQMFKSLFGKKKKASGKEPADDSIRSAKVGDIIFIQGFWDTGEDAYIIVQEVNRLESAYGESREVVGVDGERDASLEWTDAGGGLSVSVTTQERPLGLSSVGLDYDTLVEWDEFKSIENSIEFEGHLYFYRNSYETLYFKEGSRQEDGFWIWEFIRDDEEGAVTVVKREGLPFEVYAYVNVPHHLVTVYHK